MARRRHVSEDERRAELRVFVSSIMREFQEFRQAARKGITLVHHEPVMAEDFGARPESPQDACLQEVASSAIYLLIMGPQYSWDPSSDPSATEQEYDEAVLRGIPILAFLTTEEMDERQKRFAKKVGDFHGGVTRETFTTEEELRDKVIMGLSRLPQGIATHALSPQDAQTEFDHVLARVAPNLTATTLVLSATPVRTDAGLTAKQMLDPALPVRLAKDLKFGNHSYFDPKGVYDEEQVEDEVLVFQSSNQRGFSAFAVVKRNGLIAMGTALREEKDLSSDRSMDSYLLVDQEKVCTGLTRMLGYMAETYMSVYSYRGPIYVSAALLKMEHKMFGPKRAEGTHSGTMFMGEGGKPVCVPSSLEPQAFPASSKDQAALADELIEWFRLRFRKEGRLRER